VYGYEPPADPDRTLEWYVNFANYDVFSAYGGPLLAQDELQVAEHPILGSLREALMSEGVSTLTVDHGSPTPILVTGVERRCALDTAPNEAEGRPRGLYGNEFRPASVEAMERATTAIMPPTITNLIAMEAPSYGAGLYTIDEIRYILVTAFTGFGAAMVESLRERAQPPAVVVHTGFWGCGAYGGDRVLMTLLQLLAARLARLDRLVFHTVSEQGAGPFRQALQILDENLLLEAEVPTLAEVERRILALRFEWGTSNGT
jgi:hypothetical protein